jgi:hypothetical protein
MKTHSNAGTSKYSSGASFARDLRLWSSMKEGRHELIPPRIFWRHNRENQNLCKQQCWNAEEQRWKNQRYAACQTEVRRYADREN